MDGWMKKEEEEENNTLKQVNRHYDDGRRVDES